MRTATTSAAMAVLVVTTYHVESFSPLTPRIRTQAQSAPSVFQHRMVMDRHDPLNIVDAEITSKNTGSAMAVTKRSTNPTPFFVDLFQHTMRDDSGKNNMKFVAAAFAVALAMIPLSSEAAMSGGRMGGSFSSPSRSRSMPSRSSYGGGGSTYSRGYSRGYTSGYVSRPSVAITPGIGFGYNPFMSPFSPYGYGGAGVISYSRGPSFFDIALLGGFMFAVTSFFRNAESSAVSGSSPFDTFGSSTMASSLGVGTSVVQVSVALEVSNRDDPNSILGVLDRLARTSKTDSRMGIQNLTSQVALELLRRRSSIVSASSSFQNFGDRAMAGRDYEAKAIRERSKFEKETVSKYGGVDYAAQAASPLSGVDGKATMAVVTLLMAIDGDSTKVPRINSVSDVEEALRKIASDAKVDDCLQSVEILWTPEDRTETLSRRDIIADYPELRSV